MKSRKAPLLIFIILIFSLTPLTTSGDDSNPEITCEIVADWGIEKTGPVSNISTEIIHRYVVNFNPVYENGTSPGGVSVLTHHFRDGLDILSHEDISSVIAGGVIDIVIDSQPLFGDIISLSIETSDSSCSRELSITNWNQPISDHEVTRETTWSLEGGEEYTNQSIMFEGRGWQ